jgi:hypothetical protein
MPWFKVDDGFHDHPKVLTAGNAAIGLWTRCGSYASKQSTNGFIPNAIAHAYGTKTVIEKLVGSGLWIRVDGGYQMHDFLDYNPTADQVKADRRAAAERQAKWRESRRESRRDNPVTSRRESHDPDPTRPDPTPSYLQISSTSNVDATPDRSEDDQRSGRGQDRADVRPISAIDLMKAAGGNR